VEHAVANAMNLDTFQPSMETLTNISARMIVLAWPVSSRLAKMIAWHANELHCVRTDNPSRLDFFFQNPTSCLNAKNANQECSSETTNVAAIHRQSWPVNSSFTSSRSLSVNPNDSDIIRSELCIWCVSRNKPTCIGWIFSAITRVVARSVRAQLDVLAPRRRDVVGHHQRRVRYFVSFLRERLGRAHDAQRQVRGHALPAVEHGRLRDDE